MPPAQLLTTELARQLTEISQDLHRQVGVLLDRQGLITHVLVGDAKGLIIPPLPRDRAPKAASRACACFTPTWIPAP